MEMVEKKKTCHRRSVNLLQMVEAGICRSDWHTNNEIQHNAILWNKYNTTQHNTTQCYTT